MQTYKHHTINALLATMVTLGVITGGAAASVHPAAPAEHAARPVYVHGSTVQRLAITSATQSVQRALTEDHRIRREVAENRTRATITRLTQIQVAVNEGIETLNTSDGKVLDNATRTALSDTITSMRAAKVNGDTAYLFGHVADVTVATEAVQANQVAWQAHQDQVAAEQAAKAAHHRATTSHTHPSPSPAAASGVQALKTGCLKGPAGDANETQRIIDSGCTAILNYGSSPWLAAHNYNAGDSWKAMVDGQQFTYGGHTYEVTGRNSIWYKHGEIIDLDSVVYGDLTLQTCISHNHIVFIHATIVG